MNENAEKAKQNLIFNHVDKNFFSFNKRKFIVISACSLVSVIALSSVLTLVINNAILSNKETVNDLVYYYEDAKEYINKICTYNFNYPITSKTIRDSYFLNIYHGFKHENSNYYHKYFYQFGSYRIDNFEVELSFYINDSEKQTIALANYTIEEININNGLEIDTLYVEFTDEYNTMMTFTLSLQ